MTEPITHLEESLKTEALGTVDLWEITLVGVSTVVRFKDGPTVTWQGVEWESVAWGLSGEADSADEEVARPVLTITNPENILGPFAEAGFFDMAICKRKRVLSTHLDDDVNLFNQRLWIVGRVMTVTDQAIQVELRSPYDLPRWKTPARFFMPPEYPFVVM